jgi:hypothetical protein
MKKTLEEYDTGGVCKVIISNKTKPSTASDWTNSGLHSGHPDGETKSPDTHAIYYLSYLYVL